MYKNVIKPILFLLDPEFVHDWATYFGEFFGRFYISRKILWFFYAYKKDDVSKTVDGIKYKTPIILGAGFDYNGRLTKVLPSIGFGGVEVGSLTARPCEGNEPPRLIRLKKSESILVRKGLKNDGVDVIIKRLLKQKRISDFVIGISIARSNLKESSNVEDGIKDYVESFEKLNKAGVGDYYTINISCPNSFSGETYATEELFTALLSGLSKIKTTKPVYIKMPINLEWENFKTLLDVIKKFNFVKGVVIGNLNKDYKYLAYPNEAPKEFCGGISGLPCRELSNNLIKKTREYVGNSMTIIGCGGVLSPEDAILKLTSGADLVQLITGLIYTGPALIKNTCKEIAKK